MNLMNSIRLIGLLLLIAPACSAGAGGAGGAGGSLPECIQTGLGYGLPPPDYKPFDCELPSPCPYASFCTAPCEEQWAPPCCQDPFNADAATCILRKLRDRELARLNFGWEKKGQQYSGGESVFILDDSHAASNWHEKADLNYYYGDKLRQILKPPEYFSGCLLLTDQNEIYKCLKDWSDGCADTEVSCPAP